MNDFTARQIKTGGDPRMLPDYAALRDQMLKLIHPACPDVNWREAEKHCLALFEQNGVELQTAAWYTLVRTQLAGLSGLNEGVSLLEALISSQWKTLWPQPVHARVDILHGLSQRLHSFMRLLPLSHSDLSQLYLVEQRLVHISKHPDLRQISQFESLRTLMNSRAKRLENADSTSGPGIAIQSSEVLAATENWALPDDAQAATTIKWVYVTQPEHPPNAEVTSVIPEPVKRWKSFVAGMGVMLVVGTLSVWSWQLSSRSDPLRAQLAASLAPLPVTLNAAQRDGIRQQSTPPQPFIAQTRQQLMRLHQLPPHWTINHSRQLLEQAQVLWPQQADALAVEWQQQRNAMALPIESLEGWHQGMTTLQTLSDRLSQLDERKGKYITVSELKSVVFSAIQSFNHSIPAEEQLRVLSHYPTEQPLPAAARAQLEMHLKQLIAGYALLTDAE